MELYMMNRQHGRMILESVEIGPLIWPTIEENGVTKPRKYSELSPADVYALVNNHKAAKELWERIQLLYHQKPMLWMHMDADVMKFYTAQSCFSWTNFSHYGSDVLTEVLLSEEKLQQLEPKLYDCNVIKSTSAIVIPDSEETLMLAEKSHLSPSCRPTKVEVPKELPKVNMVNTSLKKLKHHLAGFDVVPQRMNLGHRPSLGPRGGCRTTSFRVKKIEVKMNQVLNENERLLEQVINKDIVNIVVHSSVDNAYTYKQRYDSIQPTRIGSKEQCDALINQVNQKSVEISELNVSLQEKDLVITALKDELRKLKGKDLADNIVTKYTIAPEMLKLDVEPIAPKFLNNRTAHSDYLRHTQEQAAILREELLIIIRQTCPSINNSSDKLVAVTLKNKDKRVRFTEPVISSGNTNIKTASSSNLVSNKPMLSSIGVKPSTSARGSQPSGNTKKDKIQRTPRTVNVQHYKLNTNSEFICVKCNGCMLSDNHDLCVLNFINDVNACPKSKSVKKTSKRKVWKPTGKVIQIILWYLDSGCSKNITGDRSQLTNFVSKFFGTIKFRNDYMAKILGYGDYQIGSVTISRASKTKSWLWHRRLSHLNFGAINHLARHGLVRGLPKLKFEKGHLCFACAMGKSKKKPYKPKSKDTNQDKLYLLSHPAKAETRGITSWISSQYNGVNNRESLHA
ncbi:retrovirus-related pol polyprotein from transposon TNT 1-94 [Tanacetum coccineum]